MSSVTDPQPDQNADEIVAYLDGELPPQDCRRVENRLATDDEFRQEMHELDRAWDALDVLPSPTVDDGFARTTIELACVAAEADLSDNSSAAEAAVRHRKWRWIISGMATAVVGFLVGNALLPHHNSRLLADLPAIHELNVLPYVDSIEFLRLLGSATPPAQFIKDQQGFDSGVKDLESVNSSSFEERRQWIQSLPADQKAGLADRSRTFDDFEPNSQEREQMRKIMDEIRGSKDAVLLQQTLVAYGQWLSRHSGAQQERLHEQLQGLSPKEQVAVVQKAIAGDEDQRYLHLSVEQANKLRDKILQLAMEKRTLAGARKGDRGAKFDEQRAMLGAARELFRELAQEKDSTKRTQVQERLVGTLSPELRTHLESLSQGPRPFESKARQLGIWIREAMDLRAKPEDLEEFFANKEALLPEKKQELLEKPWPKMEAELRYLYFASKMGQNPVPFLGDSGEPGRMPRGGPDMGPPRDGGPNRPGFGGGREPRPDGPPGERRPRNRPPRPQGDRPPPGEPSLEKI